MRPNSKIYCMMYSLIFNSMWIIGAADNANHKVYIWDIGNEGQFAAALDGGREPLVHVHVRILSFLSYRV